MHLNCVPLEEPSASPQEERVPREDDRRLRGVPALDEVADVPGRVTRGEEAFHLQAADLDAIAMYNLLGHGIDAVIPADDGQAFFQVGEPLVASGVVPGTEIYSCLKFF